MENERCFKVLLIYRFVHIFNQINYLLNFILLKDEEQKRIKENERRQQEEEIKRAPGWFIF